MRDPYKVRLFSTEQDYTQQQVHLKNIMFVRIHAACHHLLYNFEINKLCIYLPVVTYCLGINAHVEKLWERERCLENEQGISSC